MSARPTAVVAGMVAADPSQGGAVWAVLQYVLGLRRLGFDVHLVEPVPARSLRPAGVPLAATANAAYFRQVMARFGLESRATLLVAGTREAVGVPADALDAVFGRAGLLLNISGMLVAPEWTGRVPVRVYLDLDPAFNQLWQAVEGIDMRHGGHTHFVTVGQEVGQPGCPVPTCGRQWIPTLPPVVLEHWPVRQGVVHDAFTTIANWRGYGSVVHDGVQYGQKAHSFRPLIAFPRRSGERCRVALSIHPDERADLAALDAGGWERVDPVAVAGTPWDYAEFVGGSRAEVGIAKSGYVLSRCGWFSDRSAVYLASGRPVLAQDTGFGRLMPAAPGLLRFRGLEEAVEGAAALRRDAALHARGARALAEEFLDSDKVLGRLLAGVGASP